MNAPANTNQAALGNVDLEQEVLGCALINQSFDAIERLVSAGDFYEPLHAQLFETIAGVHAAHGVVNYQLVAASMGSYGRTLLAEGTTVSKYLAKLAAGACLPRDVAAHARLVREFSNRRKILAAAEALTMDVYANRPAGEAASAAIEGLDEIAVQASGAAPQVSIREADDEALAIMQHRMQNPGELAGISWGPKSLDDKTGGLKPGELIILAGRPGMGKSALGVCIANAAAKAGKPVQFFSLEMSKASLASRGMADVAFDRGPIPYFKIDNGSLSVAQAERIIEAGRLRREWPLEIDDRGGLTVSQIAARVRKHSQKLERQGKRLGLVIIDHMNLIKPSGRYSGAKVHEVTEISGALKVLAKEMAVPVLVLAQLNRNADSRDDKRPGLADLRDSGSIEQDADVVALAYRESYYLAHQAKPDPDAVLEAKNKLELNIAKQRGGPTGIVNLFCDIGCNAVRDLEDGL